eukprot:scaffold7456_cov126-Skeletonema_dohrnii-CCMP3373.AAC.2
MKDRLEAKDCVVLSLAAAESDRFKDYCHGHILPDQEQEKIPYINLILTHWQKMTSSLALLQQTVFRREQPARSLNDANYTRRCKSHAPGGRSRCS